MKEIIYSDKAPEPIGPYSQAIKIGNMIYTSGQIPLDLQGNIVDGGIKEQTKQVLENLKAVLEAAHTELDQVIKTTIFLKDMGDFPVVNEIYGSYFNADYAPARSTVEVARLPKDVLVEIEAVAIL